MRVQVSKWGNSTAIRLPKLVADALGLKPGDAAELVVEGREGRLSRAASPRFASLEEMLAEMDHLGRENAPEMVDWGDDAGDEIIKD